MNIEECIKILKEFRKYNKIYKEENKDLTITITLEAKESIDKAIERLLTAYEKEKEKNKRLEKFIENGEYTWKQKYNETFEYFKTELEKEKEKNKKAIDFINERKKTVNKDMAEGTRLQVGTFMWQVDELLEILKEE